MEMWKRKQVQDPGDPAQTADAFVIPIAETHERYSAITLDDGTVIRTKMTPLEVCRVVDRWDAEGNPVYVVKSQNLVVVDSVPEALRKG